MLSCLASPSEKVTASSADNKGFIPSGRVKRDRVVFTEKCTYSVAPPLSPPYHSQEHNYTIKLYGEHMAATIGMQLTLINMSQDVTWVRSQKESLNIH